MSAVRRTPGQEAAARARAGRDAHDEVAASSRRRAAALGADAQAVYDKAAKRAKQPDNGGILRQILGAAQALIRSEPDLEGPLWTGVKTAIKTGRKQHGEDAITATADGRARALDAMADKLDGLAPLPPNKARR